MLVEHRGEVRTLMGSIPIMNTTNLLLAINQ